MHLSLDNSIDDLNDTMTPLGSPAIFKSKNLIIDSNRTLDMNNSLNLNISIQSILSPSAISINSSSRYFLTGGKNVEMSTECSKTNLEKHIRIN